MSIFLHPSTKLEVAALARRLPHAVGVFGDSGSGLSTVAQTIADLAGANINFIAPEKDDQIDRANGSISIEMIRNMSVATKGKARRKTVYVLIDADKMTLAASNAFLKLLEEPSSSTVFFLLSHAKDKLPATIISRLQILNVRRITSQQTDELLQTHGISDSKLRQQILFIADGRPAEISRLASDQSYFESQAEAFRLARSWLNGSAYSRLKIAQGLKSDRSGAIVLMNYTIEILKHSLEAQPSQGVILKQLQNCENAIVRLGMNQNIRLTLATAAF